MWRAERTRTTANTIFAPSETKATTRQRIYLHIRKSRALQTEKTDAVCGQRQFMQGWGRPVPSFCQTKSKFEGDGPSPPRPSAFLELVLCFKQRQFMKAEKARMPLSASLCPLGHKNHADEGISAP